jgi:hypothetical protein
VQRVVAQLRSEHHVIKFLPNKREEQGQMGKGQQRVQVGEGKQRLASVLAVRVRVDLRHPQQTSHLHLPGHPTPLPSCECWY